MTDRVSSDHDSIETHRAPLETVGRTDRIKVVLPIDDFAAGEDVGVDHGLEPDAVVELALDGEIHYARVDSTLEGDLVVRRACDNRRQAREGDGENRLAEWVDDADVHVGGSVHLDVITPGHAYGVRTPGTQVVYRVTEPQSGSLADIAANLDDE